MKRVILSIVLLLILIFQAGCASQPTKTFPPPTVTETVISTAPTTATATLPSTSPTPVITTTPIITPPVTPSPTIPLPGYSRNNPAGLNIPLIIEVGETGKVSNFGDNDFKIQVTLVQFIRGNSAWQMLHDANMFNVQPEAGYEYILLKIKLDYIQGATSDMTYKASGSWFDIVSMDGKEYERPYIVDPAPQFDATLYSGAFTEGWTTFEILINDSQPLLTIGRSYDGQGGIWFKLY